MPKVSTTRPCRIALNASNNGGRTPTVSIVFELYRDFAPHSFGFAERTPDGRNGIVGGLLYHGRPDESFAVVMEPFYGWSIHT